MSYVHVVPMQLFDVTVYHWSFESEEILCKKEIIAEMDQI